MLKRCGKCKQEKETTEFYKNSASTAIDKLQTICKACSSINTKKYRVANPDKCKQLWADYYDVNKDQLNEKRAQFFEENPEIRAEYNRDWNDKHPDERRAHNQNRRARKKNAAGYFTADQNAARVDYYGGCCWRCLGPYEAIDHVIPLAKGGTNWPANLRPICRSCNSKKGSKHPSRLPKIKATLCPLP